MHSTDIASHQFPPHPPHVYLSIHPAGESCSDLGRVLVLDDPPVWPEFLVAIYLTERAREGRKPPPTLPPGPFPPMV